MSSSRNDLSQGAPPPDTSQLPPEHLIGAIAASAKLVDATLDAVLPRPEGRQARVQEAMRYAIMAGGKRLRPFLVLHSARLFGVDDSRSLRVGAAIESLHTYSLVHDDLPCMDDDDLRRGRPTTHIAFDEMTAVLAGDALLTIAFEILADARTHPSADVRCALIARLALFSPLMLLSICRMVTIASLVWICYRGTLNNHMRIARKNALFCGGRTNL